MNTNCVWEASKKTFVFIVGLHKEVKVLLRLGREKRKGQIWKICHRKPVTPFKIWARKTKEEASHGCETCSDNRQHTETLHHRSCLKHPLNKQRRKISQLTVYTVSTSPSRYRTPQQGRWLAQNQHSWRDHCWHCRFLNTHRTKTKVQSRDGVLRQQSSLPVLQPAERSPRTSSLQLLKRPSGLTHLQQEHDENV